MPTRDAGGVQVYATAHALVRVRDNGELAFVAGPPQHATYREGRAQGVCRVVRDVRACDGRREVPHLQIGYVSGDADERKKDAGLDTAVEAAAG